MEHHLTIADACDELGVARSTFYDWRAAKNAPRCIKLPNGRIPVGQGDLATGGIIALVVLALVSLAAAVVGGLAGMRFHRKVDRTITGE